MHKLFCILFITISQIAFPQVEPKTLFQSDKLLELTIATNLKSLMLDIDETRAQYHPASLSYFDQHNTPITLNIQIKTRGHFRRQKENCSFPPLRIKFVDPGLQNSLFQGQEKLKLITKCRMSNSKFEQFIIKEHLVYKAFNLITDFSFNTRMVKINYVDTEGRIKNFSTYAFFLEDKYDMAGRNNGKILSTQGIHQEAVDQRMMNELAVFQYMIGNTDWSVPKLHNIELVVINETVPLIAVPYDFDFCGIVNPPYTKPPEILPIQHVTERYYRGFCKTKEELDPVFLKFLDLKEEILGIYLKDSLLNSSEKKRIIKFIEGFYKIIENPDKREREFFENCRKN